MKKVKIDVPWVKAGSRIPTNENEKWEGQPCTPYVPCLVFIHYPGKPQGGIITEASWDSRNMIFVGNSPWIKPPYIITHFIEVQQFSNPEIPDYQI